MTLVLNNDPSNWWSPNAAALRGLCRAAGFHEATVFKDHFGAGLPRAVVRTLKSFAGGPFKGRLGLPVLRYRAFAHARL